MGEPPAEIDEGTLRQALVDFVPFNRHLDIEVLTVRPGYGVVRLPDREFLRNHVATQHAGALFLAGEAAGGAAFIGAFAEEMADITFLLKGATVSYATLARGDIIASCRMDDALDGVRQRLAIDGRARLSAEVTLRDAAETVVARLVLDYSVRRATTTHS